MPASSSMQDAIMKPVPPVGSALVFDTDPGVDPRPGLEALRTEPADGFCPPMIDGALDLRALGM